MAGSAWKEAEPHSGGDTISAKLVFTYGLLISEVRLRVCVSGVNHLLRQCPQASLLGKKVNSQGLCLSPGTPVALTVLSAEEPEQLLQLFLLQAQWKGDIPCCVLVHVCAGQGGREVPVLCLSCGGEREMQWSLTAALQTRTDLPLCSQGCPAHLSKQAERSPECTA